MPFSTSISAANTVSRSTSLGGTPPSARSAAESMIDTISDASITVTASASSTEPNGWPTRAATHLGVMHRREAPRRRAADTASASVTLELKSTSAGALGREQRPARRAARAHEPRGTMRVLASTSSASSRNGPRTWRARRRPICPAGRAALSTRPADAQQQTAGRIGRPAGHASGSRPGRSVRQVQRHEPRRAVAADQQQDRVAPRLLGRLDAVAHLLGRWRPAPGRPR